GGPRRRPALGQRVLALPGALLALAGVELELAQPDRGRRDLHALVLANELERLVERRPVSRHELDRLVRAGGANVRLLLLADGVHVEVVGAAVLADHHPLVDLLARPDEELPTLLELEEREAACGAATVGDERARGTGADLALPGLVAVED